MILDFDVLTKEVAESKPFFEAFSPGVGKLFTGKVGKWLGRAFIASDRYEREDRRWLEETQRLMNRQEADDDR